ncbi:MAG: YadA-like family protein, partial [Pseudomonadota bacterium]
ATVEEYALGSMAIGSYANVIEGASESIAFGTHSYVSAPRGMALGYRSRSDAPGAVALGTRSIADEPNTVSIGRGDNPETDFDETIHRRLTNLAAGTADTDAVNLAQLQSALDGIDFNSDYLDIKATGPHARALWTNSIAFGSDSVAGANGAVAIGTGAQSLFNNAYAIGANAQASRDSQFMIGTWLSNYSLPGLINPRSRTLQTGEIQLVTVDETGTLAGDGGETVSNLLLNIAAMNEGIGDLGQMVSDHALSLERGEQDRIALSGGLALLDNRVNQHATTLTGLRQRLSEFAHLPEEVDALGREVTDNSASIASIEQTLSGGFVTPQDLDDLDDRVTQNTSSIASLEQSVAANAGLGEDVAALNRTVDDHSTSIAGLERSLAEGAALSEETAQHLDALEGQVGANSGQIRRNAGLIQNNRADIDGNSADIERLEEAASNGEVRFETIETEMSAHETRMDGIDQSISTHANRISETTESIATVKSIASENQARIARNQASLAAQGEAISTLQSDFHELGLNVYGLAQTVAHQAQQIETNKSGIAIANALAGSSWLQANETTALTLNAGYFEGSSALAFSGTQRLHNHWSANFAVGTDTERGEIGARAGLRLGW